MRNNRVVRYLAQAIQEKDSAKRDDGNRKFQSRNILEIENK